MSKKILVIGELQQDTIRNVSFEAIAAAKKVSETAEIVALLMGDGSLENQAQEMIYYGADRAITISHEQLKQYTPEGYAQVLMKVIEEESPDGLIMGHTSIGKDITPKIAARLNSGLISDAIAIGQETDQVVFTRPIYSGKAFEKKVMQDELLFATIR